MNKIIVRYQASEMRRIYRAYAHEIHAFEDISKRKGWDSAFIKSGSSVIIAGSRSIKDIKVVNQRMEEIRASQSLQIQEIVSGTAHGVDQLGEKWAESMNIPIKRFPAEWDKYGKSAGFRRNKQMAKYADVLVAIWDGKSKGTQHMIKVAQAMGLEVLVYEHV